MKKQSFKQTPESILRRVFAEKRCKNPRYSVRAFARDLSLSPGAMSEILSSKRSVSAKMAKEIVARLSLSEQDRENLLKCSKGNKSQLRAIRFKMLEATAFKVVADWQHFAILGLLKLDVIESNLSWFSKQLGLPQLTVEQAFRRLEKLGLCSRASVPWKRLPVALTTTVDIPSAALRLSHQQTLERTIQSLHNVPVEIREITSVSIALDIDQMAAAKELIRDFQKKMLNLLESGRKNALYNLNIQLVPVAQPKEGDL